MNVEQNSNAGTFPSGDHRGVQPEYGLTKREYFAGLAMQGLLANPNFRRPDYRDEYAHIDFANSCILYAEQLLKQLSE